MRVPRDPDQAEQLLSDHIRVPQRRLEGESGEEVALQAMSLGFGVNLNNREPLIAPDYDLPMLLELPSGSRSAASTRCGSATASSRSPATSRSRCSRPSRSGRRDVRLGTACMVSSTRNPLYLALEWATLDQISSGRTILGTGIGNPEEGVRREFAALGLDFEQALRDLRGGPRRDPRRSGPRAASTSTASSSTTTTSPSSRAPRSARSMPVQTPPPIWVVSNPRLVRDRLEGHDARRIEPPAGGSSATATAG